MTKPIIPISQDTPKGRELAAKLTDLLDEVEENVKRRAAEREQDAAHTDAA